MHVISTNVSPALSRASYQLLHEVPGRCRIRVVRLRVDKAVMALMMACDLVPADGMICSGLASVDQRYITGESVLASLAEPNFLLKITPHVDGTSRICELACDYTTQVNLHGAWTGPSSLELHPHALAPVSELPVLEVVSCLHFVADLTLELGEVVHDYLA